MTIRQYITVMLIATALCWVSWWMVLVNVDPLTAGFSGFTFFYTALGLALIGSISLIAFFLLLQFSRDGLPLFRYVKKSFIIGCISATLIVLVLMLQGARMLNIWNLTLLLLVIVLTISFSFSTTQKNHHSFLPRQE